MSIFICPVAIKSWRTYYLLHITTLLLAVLLAVPNSRADNSSSGKLFNTPEAATIALITATRTDDMKQLASILGSQAQQILSSGDPVADNNARDNFVAKYDEMHRLAYDDRGRVILFVGPTTGRCRYRW